MTLDNISHCMYYVQVLRFPVACIVAPVPSEEANPSFSACVCVSVLLHSLVAPVLDEAIGTGELTSVQASATAGKKPRPRTKDRLALSLWLCMPSYRKIYNYLINGIMLYSISFALVINHWNIETF